MGSWGGGGGGVAQPVHEMGAHLLKFRSFPRGTAWHYESGGDRFWEKEHRATYSPQATGGAPAGQAQLPPTKERLLACLSRPGTEAASNPWSCQPSHTAAEQGLRSWTQSNYSTHNMLQHCTRCKRCVHCGLGRHHKGNWNNRRITQSSMSSSMSNAAYRPKAFPNYAHDVRRSCRAPPEPIVVDRCSPVLISKKQPPA